MRLKKRREGATLLTAVYEAASNSYEGQREATEEYRIRFGADRGKRR